MKTALCVEGEITGDGQLLVDLPPRMALGARAGQVLTAVALGTIPVGPAGRPHDLAADGVPTTSDRPPWANRVLESSRRKSYEQYHHDNARHTKASGFAWIRFEYSS